MLDVHVSRLKLAITCDCLSANPAVVGRNVKEDTGSTTLGMSQSIYMKNMTYYIGLGSPHLVSSTLHDSTETRIN